MDYLNRLLRVDCISRTGEIYSICYTFPVEVSQDYSRLIAIRVYFRTLSIDGCWRLGKILGWLTINTNEVQNENPRKPYVLWSKGPAIND